MTHTSTMPRRHVLVFRPLPPDQLARIEAEHNVTVANPRQADQSAAFHHALATADALIGANDPVDDALLLQAPRLKVISSVSVGIDNYDQAALQARGHRLESIDDPYMDFGSGQFIWRLSEETDHGYVAASDSRRDVL